MKNQESTGNAAKISTESQSAPASDADKSSKSGKELTDAECAAVIGSETRYRPGNNK